MRNFFALLTFAFIVLLIGRNLTFLPRFELFTNQEFETNRLKNQVKNIIAKTNGNYSVYYADLNSKDFFGVNEKQSYTAASLNKVPIVAVLYYLASKGEVNLDEKITLQKEDIQDYGTGVLRYEKPGKVYSLKTLARLALQKSDNTAAYIIASKITVEKIQKIINSWGLEQTDIVNNKTSSYDMFLLFKKIYKKELVNSSLSKELLGFMKDTDIEDRIPLLLPKDTLVYHKSADGEGSVHDVGIIEKGDILFFLGVMTSDVSSEENETKETIAKIAKEIFSFKTSLK